MKEKEPLVNSQDYGRDEASAKVGTSKDIICRLGCFNLFVVVCMWSL